MAKGKLLALFAVFAAIGLVTATGAFTTATAQRTAQVDATGDGSALLAIQPTSGPNGQDYARTNGGTVEVNLNGQFGSSGSGVNLNAVTAVQNVLKITNQGSQPVAVYIQPQGPNAEAIAFGAEASEFQDGRQDQLLGSAGPNENIVNITGATSDAYGNAVVLQPGEGITVGFYIDTSDADPSDGLDANKAITKNEEIINNIVIHASAEETGATPYDAA